MIKFNEAQYNNGEHLALKEALNGHDYLKDAKDMLMEYFLTSSIYLTANGSSALDLLFISLNLDKGSEVILPSFTFPSAANTIMRMGLIPVFVEIDKDSLIMDFNDVKKKINNKTKAIITMHYGGASMELKQLCEFASSKNIVVIEDAALSYGALYNNKALGSIADAAICSFHETKNISSIEGGVAIVNNKKLFKNIQNIYDNGTNKSDFIKGIVNNYSWQIPGMNVSMSNLNGAVLVTQLKNAKKIQSNRKKIFDFYYKELKDYKNISLPFIPTYNKNNYHVFYIIFEDNKKREEVRLYLKSKNIQAHFHYMPLHLSKMGKELGYKKGDFSITEELSECILRLPLHNSMDINMAKKVLDTLKECL